MADTPRVAKWLRRAMVERVDGWIDAHSAGAG
jgi:hypothetical protein